MADTEKFNQSQIIGAQIVAARKQGLHLIVLDFLDSETKIPNWLFVQFLPSVGDKLERENQLYEVAEVRHVTTTHRLKALDDFPCPLSQTVIRLREIVGEIIHDANVYSTEHMAEEMLGSIRISQR